MRNRNENNQITSFCKAFIIRTPKEETGATLLSATAVTKSPTCIPNPRLPAFITFTQKNWPLTSKNKYNYLRVSRGELSNRSVFVVSVFPDEKPRHGTSEGGKTRVNLAPASVSREAFFRGIGPNSNHREEVLSAGMCHPVVFYIANVERRSPCVWEGESIASALSPWRAELLIFLGLLVGSRLTSEHGRRAFPTQPEMI